jgi:excisionase family DNA binding protein
MRVHLDTPPNSSPMTQRDSPTYTIAEAAALTGLHKNTIRMRVKLGQIPAFRAPGKFGEEYRISQSALVEAGLLSPPGPPQPPSPPLPSELSERPTDPSHESPDRSLNESPHTPLPDGPYIPSQEPLLELLRRHEQSIYRLGWLESELARHKALQEHTDSLQAAAQEQELENRELRRELERAQERAREIEELRSLVREMERDTERMRQEVERHRAAATRRWWHFLLPKRPLSGG